MVPSTVLTLMPHYKPTTNGNLYPQLSSFTEVTLEPRLSETSSSSSGPSVTPPEPQDVQQRKPSAGGPLEEGSVGLILPKGLHDEEPGWF